jgi:hypothetical protein
MDLGLVLGLATGQGTAFTLGAGFGYFVLPGLEPGLQVDVTFGSSQATVASLLPYLRWVFWRSYVISPYVKVQGGRWFISEAPDLSLVGGGGGLVFFLTPLAGVQLEGVVYRLFPSDACPADGCTATRIGLSLGLYFGGDRRAAPPPRPPPLPPPPPPSPSYSAPPSPVPSAPPASAPTPRDPSKDEPGV